MTREIVACRALLGLAAAAWLHAIDGALGIIFAAGVALRLEFDIALERGDRR